MTTTSIILILITNCPITRKMLQKMLMPNNQMKLNNSYKLTESV